MSLGTELRDHAPPRAADLCAGAVAKHASWWGFAVYGVLYVMTVMTIASMFVATALLLAIAQLAGGPLGDPWSSVIALAAIVLSAPLTAQPFLRWVRRRRSAVETAVRDGTIIPVTIVGVTSANTAGIIDILNASKPNWRTIEVRVPETMVTYKALVPSQAWVVAGATVELIHAGGAYAIVLAPDDKDYVARRR